MRKGVVFMPYGMGPWGWFWGVPYRHFPVWNPLWYGGMPPYGYPWGPMSKEDEIRMLEDQAKVLQDQLEEVNSRLEELKK
jgi:hypothetical protein